MEATKLVRVVAIGETRATSDREVTLLSLELYDDALRLVWRVRFLNAEAERGTAIRDKPEVADDKSTRYNLMGVGGNSGGSNDLWWAGAELSPAVPDDARQLTVEIGSLRFDVPLQ